METAVQAHLDHLQALPFVREVRLAGAQLESNLRGRGHLTPDARLYMRTPSGERCLLVEHRRSHISRPLVPLLVSYRAQGPAGKWILFAPYVGPAVGQLLREHGINYVDEAGNCSLQLSGKYVALVEGKRRQAREPLAKGMRGPGHKVIFALLAKPALLDWPVRELGKAAGVGKTTVAQTLKRLESERAIGADEKGRQLLKPDAMLERWIAGYSTLVRPKLLMGRFRTPDATPEDLEERVGQSLGQEHRRWAWGGGAAAMRLTGHYRGRVTVLHVNRVDPGLRQLLMAVPARDGSLMIVRVPGPVAFEGAQAQTVHPLLVYSELAVSGDDRSQEAAEMIRERYLNWSEP